MPSELMTAVSTPVKANVVPLIYAEQFPPSAIAVPVRVAVAPLAVVILKIENALAAGVAALADVLMEIGVDVSRTKLMLAVQHDELIEREIAAAPVKKARRSSPRAPKPRADAARIAATHRAQRKGTFSG